MIVKNSEIKSYLRTQLYTVLLLLILTPSEITAQYIQANPQIHHPVVANGGMVVSDNRLATREGLKVLEEGGNAVDAAVTVGFVLAVTYPRAGNLGGGGFMLIKTEKADGIISIDYRETAPASSTRDMFLDKHGYVDRKKARDSVHSSGVPGTVAGLALALEKFGTISLKRALEPAARLAREGYYVSAEMERSLIQVKERMEKSPESMSVFFKKDGKPYRTGEIFSQPDLAWSLEQIMKNGTDSFYKGEIAEKISGFMKKEGGPLTMEDLASYKPEIREPVKGEYRGYQIYSMPPPSSGGVHLIQMLNMLEKFPLRKYGSNSAKSIHILTEVMKLAYADRSKYMGDPDFVDVPAEEIISDQYAEKLLSKINTERCTPSSEIKPGDPLNTYESANTTHFSVVDKDGNAVSNTYTLNFSYGNGITVPGTGILLNNEMDDFSSKPGVPNAYGLIGGEFNSVKPGKRMLSSMTPTIVMKDGNPFIVTGSPGGGRIITTVLQVILNVIDHDMNIAEATAVPRIHHQWFPDKTYIENGISKDTTEILEKRGHQLESGRTIGAANSILYDQDTFYGYSDPRRPAGLAEGIN